MSLFPPPMKRRSFLKIGAMGGGLLLTSCARKIIVRGPKGPTVRPSILFCSPRGVDTAGHSWIDLEYLQELHARGFEVDYTNDLGEMTWNRIKQYNVLVLYCTPDAFAVNPNVGLNEPSSPERVRAFVVLIERYLAAGGGVFLMPMEENWVKQMLSDLTDHWGAKWPMETILETNPANQGYLLHASYEVPLAYTDQILPSPVSAGVRGIWYPIQPHYNAAAGGPIMVNSDWQVVVKASKTAYARPVDVAADTAGAAKPPPHVFVRKSPVISPALFAIRPYRAGRIAMVNQWPQFSVGSGVKWIFDRQVLSRGFGGKNSDFGQLLENTWRWLAMPSLAGKLVGGYRTGAQTLVAPNLKKDALTRWFGAADATWTQGKSPPANVGTVYRGFIGAKTTYSSGHGTVEQYVAAAKKAGLHFIVFLDDFATLTPGKWTSLQADCRRWSDDEILLLPGYTIDANTGDHMFFFGPPTAGNDPWPRADVLTGPGRTLFDLQPQNQQGKYTGFNGPSFNWMLYRWMNHHGNHGYYHFSDNPHLMRISDLRVYGMAAIRYYKNGHLVEDQTAEYLATAAGTIPPTPVSLNEVRSPSEMAREVDLGHALTYVQASSVSSIFVDGLWWPNQYVSYNTFTSDGPMIRAWPQTVRVWTLGAREFVTPAAIMTAMLEVDAPTGLKEITLYNGPEVFRRFLPQGAKTFRETLLLDATIQRNLVLVATDEKGGTAVSFARRCWKDGSLAPVYCGDHVNSYVQQILFAHGPVSQCVTHVQALPADVAGQTWDGGPPAVIPLVTFNESRPVLGTDKGQEDGPRFENTPLLDYCDEGSGALVSRQDRIFSADVLAVVNPWNTFGPLAGPGKLMDFTLRYWEWISPTMGVPETGWPAVGVREGTNACLFRSDIRFKQDCSVEHLRLLQSNAGIASVASPAYLLLGKATTQITQKLLYCGRNGQPGQVGTFHLAPGDWFALYSPNTACSHIFIVRGEPLRMQVSYPQINIHADIAGRKVQTGNTYTFELFSLGVPVNMGLKNPAEVTRLLTYLDQPTGMKILRGRRVASPGIIECHPDNGAVEVLVPRPMWKTNLTLPLRVTGLNRRWSAGLFQKSGYVLTQDGTGKNRYRALGVDEFGCAQVPVYVDLAAKTQMLAGHPIIADSQGKELFINVIRLQGHPSPNRCQWQVSVNNPTDKPITSRLRQAMKLPGLIFAERKVTLRPGEYRVLL